MSDSLSLALLNLLEKLSPVERAVFILRRALVNGDPGVVFYEADGSALWVAALEITDGVVVAVRSILNADKLGHVAPR